MAYSFKNKRNPNGRKSREYRAFNLKPKYFNLEELPKRLSMRKRLSRAETPYRNVRYIYYRKMEKFLLQHVGRPVNKVFSKFVKEAKKYPQTNNLREYFYSFIEDDSEYSRSWRYCNYFYISNGILNYRDNTNVYRKRNKEIQDNVDHVNYNRANYPKYPIQGIGPVGLGKLWVKRRGQVMFLNVFSIRRSAFETGLLHDPWCQTDKIPEYKSKELEEFTSVYIIGIGHEFTTKCSIFDDSNIYACRITDIENYKKEKYKE